MHTPDMTRRLRLSVTVASDKFDIEGEAMTVAEIVSALKAWGSLIGGRPEEEEQIAKLTAEIDDETKKDEAALATSTVPNTP